MSKKIKISPSVSCRTYFFQTKDSRSYIMEERFHYQFLLSGLASDIWQVIVDTQDYDEVYKYACKFNIQNELNNFLKELADENLISLPQGIIKFDNANGECVSSLQKLENELEFDEEKTNWLFEHNLLEHLVFQFSYKCNLKCIHCFNDKNQDNYELELEDIKNIIDEAYNLGISTVGITGGECTYDKNFLETIRYIRKKRLSFIMNTNAQVLYDNKDLFEELCNLYPRKLKISLYSMNPAIHDKVTGVQGSFHKTVEIIKKLREKGIVVEISNFILSVNKDSYHDVLKFGKEVSAKVNISGYFVANPSRNNKSLRLTEEDFRKLYSDKDFPQSAYNMPETNYKFEKNERTICRAADFVLAVAPNYEVNPCNDFKYSLGNLKENTLTHIWNNSVPDFRKKFLKTNLTECFKEEYCKDCFYCAVNAIYENGFMKKCDSSCIEAKARFETRNLINSKTNV